jgi:TolA-binding protein
MIERSSRRLRSLTWFTALAMVAGVAGCAPASNQDQQGSDSLLREMVANDRQQIEELQQRVSRLDDRIAEMEHNGAASSEKGLDALEARVSKLETQAAPAPPPGAPLASPGPGVMGAPPGAAPSPAAGDSDTGDTGDSETASAATPAPAVPAPVLAPAPAAAPAATAPSWRSMLDQELNTSHDDDGAKIYRSGLIGLKSGKYAQGVGKLQDLQRKYPKSGLSEPAEFFAGNGLFELGKYDQAILQFNDLTMRFPNGHYATASLLREAHAFVKINDPIDARLTLQKLITEHPDAPEAPMAKSMMETLANG